MAAVGGRLIPCTSKTWAEVRPLARELPVEGPTIVENGAALHGGPDDVPPEGATTAPDGGWTLVLGPDRSVVLAALERLGDHLAGTSDAPGVRVTGLSELDDERIARLTGLCVEAVGAARDRRHGEPFLAPGSDLGALRRALREIGASGLTVTAGGRFFHLGGAVDKAAAARRVVDAWRRRGWTGPILGLGDSPNDRELLAWVPCAVLLPRSGGHDERLLDLRADLCLMDRPGPRGWRRAVETWLDWVVSGSAPLE